MVESSQSTLKKTHIILVALLILLSVLNNFSLAIASLGFLSIFIVLINALYYPFLHQLYGGALPRTIFRILAVGALLIGAYIIGLVNSGFDQRAWIVVCELILLLSLLLSISIIKWSIRDLKMFGVIFAAFIIFTGLLYVGLPSNVLSGLVNKNTIGGFIAFLSFWPIVSYLSSDKPIEKRKWFIINLVILGIIYLIGARSTWLALAGAAITYLAWPIIKRSKFRYRAWMFLVLCLIALFINFYLQLSTMPIVRELDRIILEYTGRRLYSGRQYLWPPIIEAIREKPLFGYGASATPSLFLPTGLSSHNLYLQIAIQVGTLGLLFFVILICVLWNCFWKGRDNKIVRLSAAFMVAILIHQLFEVSLTQNNLSIGILQWMIIGQGISFSIGSKIPILHKNHSSLCNVS